MAALDAKTVNAKSVETVKLNCIQKSVLPITKDYGN